MPKINGPLLRRTRRGRDESVEDVAPKLKISPGSLRNIESMRCPASDRVIGRLAVYYGIAEDDIRTLPVAPTVRKRRAA